MKTPEQIAAEIQLPRVISSGDTIRKLVAAAIEADRAQREPAVVVIRDGSAYENEDVEVIDLDFLDPNAITHQSDFDQEDIDRMLAALERSEFHEAADDVREWWADR